MNDGFAIPKFMAKEVTIRGEFLVKHRDLYKRIDGQLFEKFDSDIEQIVGPQLSDENTSED